MQLSCLFLLVLVACVAGEPCDNGSSGGGGKRPAGGTGWSSDFDEILANGNDVLGVMDKLTTEVKQVFENVKDSSISPFLTAILNVRPPQSFHDVLSCGVHVAQALSSVMDVYIKGLGSLIARMVGCLIHYTVAVLGGARFSKSFVAQKAFYVSFGVTVSGKSWADIAAGFEVNSAKADLDAILNAYTNNKGLSSLAGAPLVIFNCAYSLADICAKGTSIVESDLTDVLRLVITMIGGFANSLSANVGKTICNALLSTTSHYLKQNGYLSFSSAVAASIIADIGACNNVSVPWSGSVPVGN